MGRPVDPAFVHDFPDRAFRKLLENPKNLAELVAAAHPELAARLDFERAEPVPREFLMEDWRRRESDLLFRVPFRNDPESRPVLVCLLVEHQSSPDPSMPLRMLLYAVLYWETEWKYWEASHARGAPLRVSPVVPIVFHTGGDPWRTNRELADLMEGPELLRQFAPHWPVLFWDIAERSPRQLLESTGEWLRSLAIVRAEGNDADAFSEVFDSVLKALEDLAAQDEIRWHDLMHFVLSWAFRRRPRHEVTRLRTLAEASYADRRRKREIKAMTHALGQTWEEWALEQAERRAAQGWAEGKARGEAEGRAEGRAEGEVLGLREALQNVLEARFEDLPEAIRQRIDATTDVDRLKACIRQVVQIRSPEELNL